MDMNELVVKSEQGDEILLFYVNDSGTEQNIVTSVDNEVTPQVIEEEVAEVSDNNMQSYEIVTNISQEELIEKLNKQRERWLPNDTERLIQFYIDNKETFVKGLTTRKHLWTVACINMFPTKNVESCESKLNALKDKYIELYHQNATINDWRYYDLCHQAFYDGEFNQRPYIIVEPAKVLENTSLENINVIKKPNIRTVADKQIVKMLELYIKHKKSNINVLKPIWQKGVWDVITKKLGESPEYWHKRFLNFKQNYIRLLDKKQETGDKNITWPYLKYFDEIFKNDKEFRSKYLKKKELPVKIQSVQIIKPENIVKLEKEWDVSEMTILAKYCFDSFQDFNDITIPNKFLWTEVGRLLNRHPESCELKYNEMKNLHLENLIETSCIVSSRIPLAIILDNIIAKEVALELEAYNTYKEELWSSDETDILVKYFFENVDMLNDRICYNVCFVCASKKVLRSVASCKKHWDSLVDLYVSILNDKKENPEMEINWRYIVLFDRIFDYGTNKELLNGHHNSEDIISAEAARKKSKYEIKYVNKNEDDSSDEDSNNFDPVLGKHNGDGDQKAFKILEFYLKNKNLFNSNRLKSSSWAQVAKEVDMTPTKCAHRFRNLKQVYISYLTRECKRPDKPIVWPYYALCKKVFGYRALKSKIQKKNASDYNYKEWSAKEIKILIEYFCENFNVINKGYNNLECWTELSKRIGKDEEFCKEKFMELRKSYRKLKTMVTRNPQTKISWKYFTSFDQIYENEVDNNEVDKELDYDIHNGNYEVMVVDEDIKQEIQDDEDIQCIFVIPEGEDIKDVLINQNYITHDNVMENVEHNEIVTVKTEIEPQTTTWTNKTKRQLLKKYLNYLKIHKGEVIDSTAMWNEIASNFPNKTTLNCKKIFMKLKRMKMNKPNPIEAKKTISNYDLLEKIMSLKPQFVKNTVNKDVAIEDYKVQEILEYYLENLEEFLSPKYDRKTVWTELANKVGLPMTKVYNKVIFLKNFYIKNINKENEEIPFKLILNKIFNKKKDLREKIALEKSFTDNNEINEFDNNWKDSEVEQLLIWYLMNLEKFKNPKFVRTFLWKNVSDILGKSPLACSNKMAEMRTEYRNKVRENPEELNNWVFFDLCQKIYGTGKRSNVINESECENMSVDMPTL